MDHHDRDDLHLDEELQSLMLLDTSAAAGSFTALLGLPPRHAVELLHDKHDPDGSGSDNPSPKKRTKANGGGGGRKRKNGDGDDGLPYIHVRARRGQATDSHSLAERARREKINARMKLLQDLVPGCSKISGTALVLDKIINHVQSLQRQVEFLSMRLAAVDPKIDVSDTFNFLMHDEVRIPNAISGLPLRCNGPSWSHQLWHGDVAVTTDPLPSSTSSLWERDGHQYYQWPLLFRYEPSNPVHVNQMKTEISDSKKM